MPKKEFKIERSEEDGIVFLKLSGRLLCGVTVDSFVKFVQDEFDSGVKLMAADISGMGHADSAGVNSLIRSFLLFSRQPDRRFVIFGANRRVKEVLEIMKLTKVIDIFDSRDLAVEYLKDFESKLITDLKIG